MVGALFDWDEDDGDRRVPSWDDLYTALFATIDETVVRQSDGRLAVYHPSGAMPALWCEETDAWLVLDDEERVIATLVPGDVEGVVERIAQELA